MVPHWIDVSNYTEPFAAQQLAFLQDNMIGVCIGIQKAGAASAFKSQALSIGVSHDYYEDRPGRDISFIEAGSRVWIDVEPGCFVTRDEVNGEIARLMEAGLAPGIYGNAVSIKAVIGDSDEWAYLPLWYANYPGDHHVPDVSEFVPFNGWTRPEGWQYSSLGIAGINCDLDVEFDVPAPPPPTPQPDWVEHITQRFHSGLMWELDVVPPP